MVRHQVELPPRVCARPAVSLKRETKKGFQRRRKGRGSPLQPERMSIPCTYPHNDWLMYVLYTGDNAFMAQIIRDAARGIERAHRSEPVSDALRAYEPGPTDCSHTLRMKLLVLLDQVRPPNPARPSRPLTRLPQDEATRRRLCEFQSDLARDWRPVCKVKATRFYETLHEELLPAWVKDETVTLDEAVERARMAYLIS